MHKSIYQDDSYEIHLQEKNTRFEEATVVGSHKIIFLILIFTFLIGLTSIFIYNEDNFIS